MDYGQDTAYAAMIRVGKSHIPPHVQERLTLERWHKDFQNEIELDQQPVLQDWYLKKFNSLTTNVSEDDWIENVIAIVGILADRPFEGLPIPEDWIKNYPYAHKTYSLSDLQTIDFLQAMHLHEAYCAGRKTLRQELATEFAELYLSELKKIIESVSAKSSVGDIVKRNQELRTMVEEATYYISSPLYRTFQKRLPEFAAQFEKSKDAAVNFFLQRLRRRFNYEEIGPDYKLFTGLFREYFGAVKSGDSKKLNLEIFEAEVLAYLDMLLAENRRLNRKLEGYEAE